MNKKLTFDELQEAQKSTYNKNSSFPVSALLENIRSLYNVGSMFRTADGAGLSKLYLSGYTGYPPRKEIEKTALGSTESVSWERYEEPLDIAKRLKASGTQLVVFEHTHEAISIDSFSFSYPCCLVFGNEVDGVSQELCSIADAAITIPMYGAKQSLNVAVAFGIAAYDAVRKYQAV